jgi:hypothetical protein
MPNDMVYVWYQKAELNYPKDWRQGSKGNVPKVRTGVHFAEEGAELDTSQPYRTLKGLHFSTGKLTIGGIHLIYDNNVPLKFDVHPKLPDFESVRQPDGVVLEFRRRGLNFDEQEKVINALRGL